MRKQQSRNDRNMLPHHRRVSRTPKRCTSGSLMSAVFAHSQKSATRDLSPALPIRSVLVENRQRKSNINDFRAFRTASAAVKRGWRTLARVWQHGFFPAQIGCAADSRPRAHTLRVTGICPALRSPRTHGAAVLRRTRQPMLTKKFNRDRANSSPLHFPIPAGKYAFVVETAQ